MRFSFLIVGLFLGACLAPAAGLAANMMKDYKGYKDPTMFNRLPNYYLSISSSFNEKQFDAHEFTVSQAGKPVKQRIEGHYQKYYYTFDHSAGAVPSALQIIRNYQNAAAKIGAEMLYEFVSPRDRLRTTLRLKKDGRETWAEVEAGDGNNYYVYIIERQAMQQQVTASAEAMQSGLTQNGHVEVPGIFFDFNKADIKPESGPALKEVAKLLKATPGIRVWVVGHTDYVGAANSNVTLAGSRADAVVKALVQDYGIDAKRLNAYGVGPYAPVASNATEEGRAKNRRVELVVQPSNKK
jgi:outer membrane protein OmpA-like peptidoglycan-associated protein